MPTLIFLTGLYEYAWVTINTSSSPKVSVMPWNCVIRSSQNEWILMRYLPSSETFLLITGWTISSSKLLVYLEIHLPGVRERKSCSWSTACQMVMLHPITQSCPCPPVNKIMGTQTWSSRPTHRNSFTTHINSYSASRDNWCTVGGDGGCRVSEVRAGTTSPMPDHKGFKPQ